MNTAPRLPLYTKVQAEALIRRLRQSPRLWMAEGDRVSNLIGRAKDRLFASSGHREHVSVMHGRANERLLFITG